MFTPLSDGAVLQSRYRIISRLDKPNSAGKGKGNMGAVYLAEDLRLRAEVAVKQTYVGEIDELGKAFQREAALLANLKHPALPKVIDYFLEADGQFLVMELVRGEDLDDVRMKYGGKLPVEMTLKLADQLLETLEFLHTQPTPIIHRDIKPSNLKLTDRGQLMLLDFGIAKGRSGLMTDYERSVPALTPAYAPPEQIEGEGTEARSDLYSAAATFYHLLTGTLPPHALAVRARNIAIGKPDALKPIHELNDEVSPEISAVFQKALSLDIQKRPLSAAIMREELAKASKKSRSPLSLKPQPQPQPANNQFWETIGAIGMLLFLGFLVYSYFASPSGNFIANNNNNGRIPGNINYNDYINASVSPSPKISGNQTSLINSFSNFRANNSNFRFSDATLRKKPVISVLSAAYNSFENGKKGMKINLSLNTDRYEHIPLQIRANFYKAGSNEALKDRNGLYKTSDGSVSTQINITADELSEKASLFIPYEELELENGQHVLSFVVEIWNGVVIVEKSAPQNFTYTQNALGLMEGKT